MTLSRLTLTVADVDPTILPGLIAGSTAAVVPLLMAFLMRAAYRESLALAGSQSVVYSKAIRICVLVIWVLIGTVAILAAFTVRGTDLWNAAAIVALFTFLALIMHAEAFGVAVTWDDQNIYTRSSWRTPRTIPFSSVTSCDYSSLMQWYRIHTAGHGVVRLHLMMRGIPNLLQVLPCVAPPYPPRSIHIKQ